MADSKRTLTLENMNPNIKALEYAVRGPIVVRAVELQKELLAGGEKPFKSVVRCNIGDCHATGQQPNTFMRQVIALVSCPSLLENSNFPQDTKDRAKRLLKACGGESVGSYSESRGIEIIRQDVAAYIERRDGIPSDPNDIFLSTGASGAIKSVLQLMVNPGESDLKKKCGIMVPIPQYPLYSATNAEYGAYQINYYMDESNDWGLSVEELERAYNEDGKDICVPKAIVAINPGNPTGQVYTRKDMENLLYFAHKHRLVVLADEVYQHNVYRKGAEFLSFKKVLNDCADIKDQIELASFMSCSKGYMGECGFRGGYCELINFDPDVKAQLYKALSANLCPSVLGQVMMDCVVAPPQPGDPSYELFTKEKEQVLADLKEKARMATDTFNSMEGFRCNEVSGAMYAFARIEIPEKAKEEANEQGVAPDFLYCKQLLEETGICVVPGSGFGQKPGTHHFRMTILPPVDVMKKAMEDMKCFHAKFLAKYADAK